MSSTVIFMIVCYFGVTHARAASFVPTVVAISLPLSAMWAAVNTGHVHLEGPTPRARRVIPLAPSDLASGKSYGDKKDTFGESTKTTDSAIDDSSSTGLTTPRHKARFTPPDDDLEMQTVTEGVHVNRTFSVRSE